MSTLKEEKYPVISKLISGWLLLTGIFLILEVLLGILGFPIVDSVNYDNGFEVMRSSYSFASSLVMGPILIIGGVSLYQKTSNSWLVSLLGLFFMFHEFFFTFISFNRLNLLDSISFDYLGYLIGMVIINIPSMFYLYKLRP